MIKRMQIYFVAMAIILPSIVIANNPHISNESKCHETIEDLSALLEKKERRRSELDAIYSTTESNDHSLRKEANMVTLSINSINTQIFKTAKELVLKCKEE